MDNFQAYGELARVYDMFQDNVDYQTWGKWLKQQLAAQGITDGLVLDLGCGTGTMTEILAEAGYDMIGVDNSGEMLAEAMEKRVESGHDILYLLQDMQEFELYGTIRAVVSVCDSMNYIMSEEDLRQVFSLVNNYLDPGGIFIFDMNTRYKYEELLGDNSFCETREDSSFIWENYYDPEEQVNQYDLTLFIKEEDDLFRRYEETHFQRAYEIETVRKLIEEAGMKWEGVFDVETGKEPTACSERIYIIAREQGK